MLISFSTMDLYLHGMNIKASEHFFTVGGAAYLLIVICLPIHIK